MIAILLLTHSLIKLFFLISLWNCWWHIIVSVSSKLANKPIPLRSGKIMKCAQSRRTFRDLLPKDGMSRVSSIRLLGEQMEGTAVLLCLPWSGFSFFSACNSVCQSGDKITKHSYEAAFVVFFFFFFYAMLLLMLRLHCLIVLFSQTGTCFHLLPH